ncbi:MAG: class I SAM-dependent methyltransferase [Saprospiraceae bacterium]|jgi:2-polyprenyl-3-methyl-5-hydroxy-6-metoxy-1,4-benzoquinol methylase|nr:class I SAM-dependent methyltransferase [Saprospiraceae bacterium]
MRRNYKGIPINTSKNTHETVFGLMKKDTNAVVVDIPCGAGAFVQRLIDNGFNHIIAVDIENMLEIEHPNFIIGDMTKPLTLKDDSVDAIICIDGIEHISRQFDFVGEISRALKTGGEFIVSTPNISSLRSRWRWLFTGHHNKCKSPLNEKQPNAMHHIGMVSLPEMRYLLHTNGLKIQSIATNQIKPISWLYALIVPFSYIFTWLVYSSTGKKEGTADINRETRQQMFSKAVLFGETLIVKAIKTV